MVQSSEQQYSTRNIWLTVIVCGLGYFVDIYDLILFSIVRPESLTAIGVSALEMQDASELILNAQMIGMLLGGAIFGALADKRGRLSVLLGSILMYSIMNIANAFVTSVEMYAVLRFFSGIGLAGELGVAITLVSEVMPKHKRGYGTTVVASLGIMGAVGAYTVHALTDWRIAFIIGGVLGLALLVMRVRIRESGMFHRAEEANISRGNILMLFQKGRIGRYLANAAIGVPVWYVIGILVTFAPEFTRHGGGATDVSAGQAVMWAYVGLAAGDLLSGLISQWIKSRRKTIMLFLGLTAICVLWYLFTPGKSAALTYLQTGLLGFSVGYWAVFVTTAAEQFGTNIRATVATTIPNVARGALVPALLLFGLLRKEVDGVVDADSLVTSAVIVGGITLAIAAVGVSVMKETYGKSLDYFEPA